VRYSGATRYGSNSTASKINNKFRATRKFGASG
jgi:hypothetical protein